MVLQFQHILWLHQHKAGWVWWGARPNASLAVKKEKTFQAETPQNELRTIPRQSVSQCLMGVHVHEAEALRSWRFALDQANISFIQICKRIQGLQNRLNGGGGLHILNDHSCKKTHTHILYLKSLNFLDTWLDVGLHTFTLSEDRGRVLWTLLRMAVAALSLCLLLTFFLSELLVHLLLPRLWRQVGVPLPLASFWIGVTLTGLLLL